MCQNRKAKAPLSSPREVEAGENIRAEICRCGSVQLHLGPLSLRYTRESFAELAQLVAGVQARLGPWEGNETDQKKLSREMRDFLERKSSGGEA